ncbi:MAG: MFS transporter [Myxococcales bacterium]|jgi:POT family proton-dependent oligopeptide transporter|nr:MFS transporter [Myxococcales bacterium]
MRRYPPGFLSLSASVACERFGFFLLASLLLLYLNEQLGFTTAQAADVLGCFIAATYVSPLLAGAITDGRFGIVRAASLGYLVAAAGYALMAAESRPMVYAGLTLVALGAGAAKLAPQSIATHLFTAEPELRDRGLMLMYLLANVSALVSPVIGETARAWLGWPAAFALASLSLVAAWLILQAQSHVLRATESEPSVHGEASKSNGSGSLGMLMGLCALSVLLTVPHMQAGSTLLLWARDNTNRHVLGWELPVPYVASLHAGLVLAVSPLLARALLYLKTTPGLPTAAAKIAIGVAATGLAYLPLVVAALLESDGSQVGLGWLLGCLALLSVGELLVGALGPSFVLRLAPPTGGGRWLGAWYGATAVGYWMAGRIGGLWDRVPHSMFFIGLALLPLAALVLVPRVTATFR